MRFDLVIFDCDGVLVDSEPVANRAFAEELAEIGLTLTEGEVTRRFVGLSLSRCVELIREEFGREVPADFIPRLQRRTFEAFRSSLAPVDGIVEALDRIELPWCVASSGEPEKMRFTLGLTGLLPRFEGRLFSAVDVARGKPHPDLFLHAAKRCGAGPARAVVVEDSLPGVQAGIAAGMTVLAYDSRGDGAALAAAGGRIFGDMRQLPDLLASV